jgi:putative serine protease PepD
VEPGNSGGPVVNRAGEVIGMVASFVLGDTSQSDYVSPRLAYAVPSNAVAAFLRETAGP